MVPLFMESVKEHREKIDRKHPEDFIDRFLIHGMDEEEKGNHTHIFSGRQVCYYSAYEHSLLKVTADTKIGSSQHEFDLLSIFNSTKFKMDILSF